MDDHTIALAALSLASKSTEAPRRFREFLIPAWRLMHHNDFAAAPLTIPSPKYDSLRSTLVQAELVLLRVLKFELRIPQPLEWLPRYLDRTMGELNTGGGGWPSTEDYDEYGKEHQEEFQIVDLMDTGIGRTCRMKAIDACKDYQLSNFFPARTIAAVCLWAALRSRGLDPAQDVDGWLKDVTGGKVDNEDFQEALAIVESW